MCSKSVQKRRWNGETYHCREWVANCLPTTNASPSTVISSLSIFHQSSFFLFHSIYLSENFHLACAASIHDNVVSFQSHHIYIAKIYRFVCVMRTKMNRLYQEHKGAHIQARIHRHSVHFQWQKAPFAKKFYGQNMSELSLLKCASVYSRLSIFSFQPQNICSRQSM